MAKDHIELNYKTFGEGPDVIVLHGLFGMLDNWKSFARELAEDYKVWILDQRDHGKSPHSKEFDYSLLSGDLHHFFQVHGISSAYLIGHSMGGKTAMTFASLYPTLIHKQVIVDIAPKPYPGGHEYIIDAILSIPIDSIQSRKEVDALLDQQGIKQLAVRQFLMKNLSRHPEGGYRWKANFQLLAESYAKIMSSTFSDPIKVDTLFVKGERSDYIAEDDKMLLTSLFPSHTLVEIAGAGHWVHAEKPRELLDLVRGYFKK